MRNPLFLLSLLLLILPSSYSQTPNPNTKPPLHQAHTELINFGFPIGLLPASVKKYTLNQTSGDFAVDLGGTCKITLPPDNYLATYSKRITGKIENGKMAELDGIRVRALFKWWSITGIRSSGDNLVFEVGMVTAKYPAKNFGESPFCEGRHSSS
ncbi:Fibronectin type III domain-containing protein isoform 1 [Hibiscus syriacus]|uniref:Fibronectin type III domain-containing protein isoform 1 n=1 Tax=Hibiscus syriacus TaxID=106335 RepID=A0A6A2YG35_HIBSY|nr:uncharacterized protein LOC120166579 [Hibiscus syriacus]KAE8675909.1 Fibronectin type III domain-containing protein isoform 1 [Hibiscus syriacus]